MRIFIIINIYMCVCVRSRFINIKELLFIYVLLYQLVLGAAIDANLSVTRRTKNVTLRKHEFVIYFKIGSLASVLEIHSKNLHYDWSLSV